MHSITSQPFHGTPGGYVRRVGAMWLGNWWWAVALPIILLLILAINEAVWLFVAMMVLFLLYPGLTMLIYFNYAFSPEARRTLYNQTVTINSETIAITYIDKNNCIEYSVNEISSIEYNAKNVLVKLKKPRYNHISIPLSAINNDDKDMFFELIDKLNPGVA